LVLARLAGGRLLGVASDVPGVARWAAGEKRTGRVKL